MPAREAAQGRIRTRRSCTKEEHYVVLFHHCDGRARVYFRWDGERIDISRQYLSPILCMNMQLSNTRHASMKFQRSNVIFFLRSPPVRRVRECRCRATSYNLIQISTVPVEGLTLLPFTTFAPFTTTTNSLRLSPLSGILNCFKLFVLSFPRHTNNLSDTS